MKKLSILFAIIMLKLSSIQAQAITNYEVELKPISIPGLPGLHSYAFGQDQGKWLIIGGRRDGLHARQPFNSFPQNQNNDSIYVIDVATQQFWSAPLNGLATAIREQLQSTNMNFYQDGDSLYIIGGYAFSPTANNHITFPNLSAIDVPAMMNAITNGTAINSHIRQISSPNFAVSGGQLGKIGNTFYLVGGHNFNGRYNPMGNPTYTQSYTNQIRKFQISQNATSLSITNYQTITDAVHLRRRDYNLMPQIFPDGTEGYTISSGVFQATVDLPFLYPVDITANGHTPITAFNQYLSNYHSAHASFYDSLNNEMHSLFFGGMSQYYYQNGNLIQDNQVPFVKTISRLTRFGDSSLQEFQLSTQMPNFKGASAEFILNENLPNYESGILKLSNIQGDSIVIGHIFGGILSNSLNPFSLNQTNSTSADPSIYQVNLIRLRSTNLQNIKGEHDLDFEVFPNPVKKQFTVEINLEKSAPISYLLSNAKGQVIQQGVWAGKRGKNNFHSKLNDSVEESFLILTLAVEHKYFYSKKLIVK
ncbi:MAG: hypothetical protein RIC95_03375 [Vicingaceae bacterium]